MKYFKLINILVAVVFTSGKMFSQLSSNPLNHNTSYSLFTGYGTWKDASISYLPAQKVGYFGISADINLISVDKSGVNLELSSPVIFDLIGGVAALTKWTKYNAGPPHFTSYFKGRIGKNLIVGNSFSFGLGLSLNDYFVLTPYVNSQGDGLLSRDYSEPSGWHWTAGPAFFLNIGSESVCFNVNGSLNFSYAVMGAGGSNEQNIYHESNYPKPWVLELNPRLIVKKYLIGIDYSRMIDKGVYNHELTRFALMVGLRLPN